ncbi:MAG: SufD family Fe-S cluster assembly protein [Nitrososphaerota archaeon]
MKNVKNAKSANYLQIDHIIKKLLSEEGVILRPSPEAYEEFEDIRRYLDQKPEEGYMIWIKKQIKHPINTCIAISSPKIHQRLNNIVIVESGIEAEMYSICNAVKPVLCGVHEGYTKIILKENASLKLRHFHKWGIGDEVITTSEFILENGATLHSSYKCISPLKKLEVGSLAVLNSRASANFEVSIMAKNEEANIDETMILEGDNSNGIIKLRMISDSNARIMSRSKIIANGAGRGHIDCMGLLLSNDSIISSVPEIFTKNKGATLTHEASIGKISETEINYLRSRGLTEEEAINLIVTGFLGEALIH